MNSLSWNDFKLVKAIADAKGMTGAAAMLKINHSTVFRQLTQVEQALGVTLFERRRNGYVLTPAGREMTALAERMEGEVLEFSRKLSGHGMTPAGELRVTTSDVILTDLLMPLLPGYLAAYAEIRLDIVQTNQALSLSRSDADIALRATDAPPENLVGRRIGSIGWAIYGNAGAFSQRETFPAMEELLAMRWVGLGEALGGSRTARYLAATLNPDRIVLRLNTVLGLAEAVENRVGVAALPCYIGDARPGLVRLSGIIPQLESGLWLLTHADLRHAPRVRSFMDFIGAELARKKTTLEGKA